MRLRSRDLVLTGGLFAGAVFLYALQNSRVHTPAQARTKSPVPAEVRLPSKPRDRMLDRYRQFGLPAATDMLLYFPVAPASLPRPLPAIFKKL